MVVDPDLFLIPRYYVEATEEGQKGFLTGQMYWCPYLHFRPDVQLLRITVVDPLNKEPTQLLLERMSKDAFTDVHKPNLFPPLGWDEELMVHRAKRRSVILLSAQSDPFSPRGGKERPPFFLAAPVYSFPTGATDVFKAKVRIFNYPDLFFMPADDDLNVHEGFVDFGQMQVVPRAWLIKRNICLTADALEMILSWFHYFVTGDPNGMAQLLLEFRKSKLGSLTE